MPKIYISINSQQKFLELIQAFYLSNKFFWFSFSEGFKDQYKQNSDLKEIKLRNKERKLKFHLDEIYFKWIN